MFADGGAVTFWLAPCCQWHPACGIRLGAVTVTGTRAGGHHDDASAVGFAATVLAGIIMGHVMFGGPLRPTGMARASQSVGLLRHDALAVRPRCPVTPSRRPSDSPADRRRASARMIGISPSVPAG